MKTRNKVAIGLAGASAFGLAALWGYHTTPPKPGECKTAFMLDDFQLRSFRYCKYQKPEEVIPDFDHDSVG